LSGITISENEAKETCNNVILNKDLAENLASWNGNLLNPNDVANPCGLAAKYFFNDSYELFDKNSKKVEIDETNITFEDDKGSKFIRAANSENV